MAAWNSSGVSCARHSCSDFSTLRGGDGFVHRLDMLADGVIDLRMAGQFLIAGIGDVVAFGPIADRGQVDIDEGGAEISGKPLSLASALAKIDQYSKYKVLPNAQPTTAPLFIINPLGHVQSVMNNLFSTHPSTASRIEKLKAMASKTRR